MRPLALLLLPLLMTLPAWSKTVRNYYTADRIACMKDNVARYDWAQKERDRIIKEADKWVEGWLVSARMPNSDLSTPQKAHS